MTRFLVTNDWHLSSRAPSSRIDNYQDELFELLDQIALLAVKLRAHVLVPGDLFHTAGGVSWALFFRLLDYLRSLQKEGIEVFAVPGNHDLKFNRLDSLPDLPLGVLFKLGLIHDVSFTPTYVGNVTLYGVPFPDSFKASVWDDLKTQDFVQPAVLLTHCFTSPAGGDYFGEPVWSYPFLAELPFQVFCFGHDHTDGGVVDVGGKTFINLGALSRGSISHDDIGRDIKVALVTFASTVTPPTVQQIRLKYRPAAEIFDLKRKAELDAEKAQIAQFVEALDAQVTSFTPGLELNDRIMALGLGNAVHERVVKYLQEAS